MSQTLAPTAAAHRKRTNAPLPRNTMIGFVIAIASVVVLAMLSYKALADRTAASDRVAHSTRIINELRAVLTTLQDAETGQRGFLLTGDETYLQPYTGSSPALEAELQRLRSFLQDSPDQLRRLEVLQQVTRDKLDELARTIELRRAGQMDAVLRILDTDRGKMLMDAIRNGVGDMQRAEQALLEDRQMAWKATATNSTAISVGGSLVLLVLIILAFVMTSRDYRRREAQSWIRVGQMILGQRIQGEQRLEVLGENVLAFLAEYLDAQVGAAYVAEGHDRYRYMAGYAFTAPADPLLRGGDGLLGQAARNRRPLRVRQVPTDHLPVSSSLGRSCPVELIAAPAIIDGRVEAVIELGFFRRLEGADEELLERVSELLAVAVRSSRDRTRLEELLSETQRQAEALQAQQEELRVSNEELEEQGRALRESQAQLQNQQAELEQINSQLEEQTQLLEHQKSDLSEAQQVLAAKAAELERANQYKSQFLANMSHELRTPLNSSLILSKLLADNREGNLSDEQVRFAQTICAAGNDLLTLINDILDLSKIEAGQVEMMPEPVQLSTTLQGIVDTFEPVAAEKALRFSYSADEQLPERIETDAQRLAQILKNLLSNAFKFTHEGEVTLRVETRPNGSIAFSVSDTGIGIPPDQQDLIFDVFRQADGSTHRKFGGTGLGLSISRQLARMLGGDISVSSIPGTGSVFTLTLPRSFTGSLVAKLAMPSVAASAEPASPRPAPAVVLPEPTPVAGSVSRPAPLPRGSSGPAPGPRVVHDDRGHRAPGVRTILVIEDDLRFAVILRDLAHEMGFQCLIAQSASEGLSVAQNDQPDAIVLDMNLPDHSGLGVLDRLKHDPRTRHIPVHVASVADYTQEALGLGAIGYALKPVKREQLVNAFRRLEAKFSQSMRRVLVVEDDLRQREAIRELLAADDVKIVGAADAGQALAQLQDASYDCVVMDLNLPDLSGYELLERMAAQVDISFPPVIVYTGRSMSADEEQRLRRYSKSIIIKDARSPERLLDEVTLFLHQVESELPLERQRMLKAARSREAALDGRRVLIVEDDARNVFALTSVLEPKGIKPQVARNGLEALSALEHSQAPDQQPFDLVLMDIMMPEMDGFTAMREIRKKPEWRRLPIIALTAKAMKDDQDRCLSAGANDYIAKPLDVEKLLSLIRVWMPK
jgi:signal transduction histidine kinase/DNA-binding response OmpR family regulator/CHASE3 domain sensor protein